MSKKLQTYIASLSNDTILTRLTDSRTSEQFPRYSNDQTMFDKLAPTINGTIYPLPLPTHTPYHRMLTRLASRNNRNNRHYYHHTCVLTHTPIITTYHPHSPYIIYSLEARHSDQRDPLKYCDKRNPNQSFLHQFHTLKLAVPRLPVYIGGDCDNCNYSNGAVNSTNCYLCDTCSFGQNLRYCSRTINCSDGMDCYKIDGCHHCYHAILCQDSTKLQYCLEVKNSSDCYYSAHLLNCHHCFGCHNLNNASYHIYNQAVTKPQRDQFIQQAQLPSYIARQQHKKKRLTHTLPHTIFPATNQMQSDNCIGNAHYMSANCFCSYDNVRSQDLRYTTDTTDAQDCFDVSYAAKASKSYNSFSIMGYGLYCCSFVRESTDCYYCDSCHHCNHCFGCVGLKNKSYCILNRQYNKEAYYDILDQLIPHMQATGERGKFFEPQLTTYPYNHTVAHEYQARTQAQATTRGYTRQNDTPAVNLPPNAQTISAADLPDQLSTEYGAQSMSIILGHDTQRPFRIITSELQFYHQHQLPLPRLHHDSRYKQRKNLTPNRHLYFRTCDQTGQQTLSVFPPKTPHPVYSPTAYQQTFHS